MTEETVIFFSILSFAYFTQTVTGFGSNMITLTFGGLFFSADYMLPIILSQNIFFTGYLVFGYTSSIDLQVLKKLTFPSFLIAFPVGVIGSIYFSAGFLIYAFAALVIFVSSYGLFTMKKKGQKDAHQVWPYLAAFSHGMFAAGGPFLVYYAARLNLDKLVFRTQLSIVWLTLNATLLVVLFFRGNLTMATSKLALWLAPAMLLGLFVGEILQKRLSPQRFLQIVYVLMLFSGLAMLVK